MIKAYDRVDWQFLREMLKSLGFLDTWINKVMICVETVQYRIKINGNLSEEIYPSRGLRHGDPLPPYLFIICQEWLSSQLTNMQVEKKLEGI